jgi:MFS family permease
MIFGFSLLEGIGSALMIPPIYILITVSFDDLKERARAFGIVSAMAGLGAAAGPLIGGTITTAATWRLSFALEVVVVVIIWLLARSRIQEPPRTGPARSLDVIGAVLCASALASVVLGILLANNYGWFTARKDFEIGDTVILSQGSISPVWLFVGAGVLLMTWFVVHIHRRESHGREPLIATRLFRNRVSNLGLITQLVQWFTMIGTSFVIAVFLQVSREYSAIQTGLIITPTTLGLLISSAAAGRLARRRAQRTLIIAGFVASIAGTLMLLFFVDSTSSPWALAPGLFTIGVGVGVMLTASVNVVQGSVPESDQGDISGVSRSASNLGSSMGVAVAGAILVSSLIAGVSARAEESTVLSEPEKDQLSAALQQQVSALSDTQVEELLQGQSPEVVDEVTTINREARNDALVFSLISLCVVGVIGLLAALFLPPNAGAPPETAPTPPPPRPRPSSTR